MPDFSGGATPSKNALRVFFVKFLLVMQNTLSTIYP